MITTEPVATVTCDSCGSHKAMVRIKVSEMEREAIKFHLCAFCCGCLAGVCWEATRKDRRAG